jgi:sugar O-acyltransferase (sialic acid O-acetyltransferase NeuD family)
MGKMFLLVGAGGHAKVVIDILKKNQETIIGILDDNPNLSFCLGYPILGKISDISRIRKQNVDYKVIIAIGDNQVREKIVKSYEEAEVNYGIAIHPSAVIDENVIINPGTVIMANVVINSSSTIGSHVILNTAATVDHDCKLSDFVHISPGVNLAGNVKVGKKVHIGIGASVIPGVTIGDTSIIGAGSTVINPIDSNVVAVGTPARIVKRQ